jgi:hypothetical protein
MLALHSWCALKFRNPALGARNQNLESTAIHGWCLCRTVFLTMGLLLRPRHPKCSSGWITIPTNLSLTPEFAAYRSSAFFRCAHSAGQRVRSRGEQRPAEPRAPIDGEQRLTDPSTRIDLGGHLLLLHCRERPSAHFRSGRFREFKPRLHTFSWWLLHIAREASRASGPVLEGGPGSQNRPGLLGTECDQNIDWKQQTVQVEFMI